MNAAYIRAKVKAYPYATPAIQQQILRDIGVCAGLLPSHRQHAYLAPKDARAIAQWLEQNAVSLKLPPLEINV